MLLVSFEAPSDTDGRWGREHGRSIPFSDMRDRFRRSANSPPAQAICHANGLLKARALSMKSLAKGLRVRFFIVTITTDNCRAGNSTGNTLSGRFLALKRIIDSGSTVRKRPAASK